MIEYWVFLMIFIISLGSLCLPSIINKFKNMKYKKLMIESDIKDIDTMNGYEFENYLMTLFEKIGYRVTETQKSGDFGADVILDGKNKIVIQAKRYGYKNKVSLNAIREVYASKAYYKADEAWVITNSFFTKQAKELAEACNVKLLDQYELQKFIVEINP